MSEVSEKIRETGKPRGQFKHRYWYFADTPNIGRSYSVIWKDLWRRADFYRHLKYRGGCTIPLFQLSVLCEKFVAARHYAVIWTQLLIPNDRNRVRWVVLGLSQDGTCTALFENFRENSLKGDQSLIPNSTHLFSHWSIPLRAILTLESKNCKKIRMILAVVVPPL